MLLLRSIPAVTLSNSLSFVPTTLAGAIFPLLERVESNALVAIFSDVTAPSSILSVVIIVVLCLLNSLAKPSELTT